MNINRKTIIRLVGKLILYIISLLVIEWIMANLPDFIRSLKNH
jgi:hypothetical protein